MDKMFSKKQKLQICEFIHNCIKDEITNLSIVYDKETIFEYNANHNSSKFSESVIPWGTYCSTNSPWSEFDEKYEFTEEYTEYNEDGEEETVYEHYEKELPHKSLKVELVIEKRSLKFI